MTLRMLLRYKNPDASQDINLRLKDVAAKGFLPYAPSVPFVPQALGAEIVPVPLVLQVTVSPFVLINYDGAVVTSDTVSAPLTVASGQINYVVCRARYRLMDSPILQMQVLTQAAYLADPELPWLHVAGVVDLSVGGPYTSVPANKIFYEARDAVDEQTRSSWREPVANSGLLPIPPGDHNRHGDVRLVTSTGSLYWWNDTASLWEVFDEVPLITHRDLEHTNGITGDSSPGTLLPGVSGAGAGSNLTIAAVPVGSAYTVDGRLLQIPAAPLSILASSVGASRGLIRVEMDFLGNATASYRASSGTNNVDYARIVNMSDAHPAGIFTLSFLTAGGGTLQWDSGPPVVVPVAPSGARRYRLFRPNGTDWVEVVVNNLPAAPGINTSDNYTVTAPTDFETALLIGYWFWDGSGAKPLIVGQDKRRFGNLAFPQMSTDFKEVQFNPPEAELRGNMVYSGGTISILSGLTLRITGPIISYIGGKRFETPAFYTGTVFPANQTRYVYVDEAGLLQIQVQDPATVFDADGRPIQVAEVARVVTNGVTATTIEDRRDPQLIVGQASRNVRVRMTPTDELRYEVATKTLNLTSNGLPGGTNVIAGAAVLVDGNLDISGGSGGQITGLNTSIDLDNGLINGNQTVLDVNNSSGFLFDDNNTPGFQSMTAPGEGDLTVLQPLNPTPSVFGTLRDLQRAKKFNYGVETNAAPSIGAGTSVNIAAGTFYDALGRRITTTSTTNVVISAPVANSVYAIAWDPDLTTSGSFKSVDLTSGNGCDIQDLPFAIVVLNGTATAVSLLEDVRRFADGQYDRNFITVGPSQGFQDASFAQLRKALLHIMAFDDDEPAPKTIRIIGNITETQTAAEGACIKITNAVGFPWAMPERLSNVKVVGAANTSSSPTNHGRPTITWSSTSGALIDFNLYTLGLSSYEVKGFGFQGVNFTASGAASVTDHARCLFRNPGLGLQVIDCSINGSNLLSHICAWTDSVVDLGGLTGSATTQVGTLFLRVYAQNCVANGGDAIFYFGDGTGTNNALVTDVNGRLTASDCLFECSAGQIADYFIWSAVEASTSTNDLAITIDRSTLNRFQRIFKEVSNATKLTIGCKLIDLSLGVHTSAVSTVPPTIQGSQFSGTTCALAGAGDVIGCVAAAGVSIVSATGVRYTGCDLSDGTIATASTITNAVNCNMILAGSVTFNGVLSACTLTSSAVATATWTLANSSAFTGCQFVLGAFATLTLSTASAQVRFAQCSISKSNTNTESNTQILLSGTGAVLTMTDVLVDYSGTSTSTTAAVSTTGSSSVLEMHGCRIVASLRPGPAIGSTALGAGTIRLFNTSIYSGAIGVDWVRTSGADDSSLVIVGCLIESVSSAIDVEGGSSGSTTEFIEDVRVEGCHIESSGSNMLSFQQCRLLTFAGNTLINTDTVGVSIAASCEFGLITNSNTAQRSLIVSDNTFKSDRVGLTVNSGGFENVNFSGNSIIVTPTPISAYARIVVNAGAGTTQTAVVSGNNLFCNNDSAALSATATIYILGGVSRATITGNVLWSDADGGAATAQIDVTSDDITVTGNTLTATSPATGVLYVTAEITGAGGSRVTTTGNTLATLGDGVVGNQLTSIDLTGDQATITSNNVLRQDGRSNGNGNAKIITSGVSRSVLMCGNSVYADGVALVQVTSTVGLVDNGVCLGNIVEGGASSTISNSADNTRFGGAASVGATNSNIAV